MNKCQDISRRDVMLRHQGSQHKKIIHAYLPLPQSSKAHPPPQSSEAYPPPPSSEAYPPPPPPPPPPPLPAKKEIVFQHPFTMMISGPIACGKTTMVKELLKNNSARI